MEGNHLCGYTITVCTVIVHSRIVLRIRQALRLPCPRLSGDRDEVAMNATPGKLSTQPNT